MAVFRHDAEAIREKTEQYENACTNEMRIDPSSFFNQEFERNRKLTRRKLAELTRCAPWAGTGEITLVLNITLHTVTLIEAMMTINALLYIWYTFTSIW